MNVGLFFGALWMHIYLPLIAKNEILAVKKVSLEFPVTQLFQVKSHRSRVTAITN